LITFTEFSIYDNKDEIESLLNSNDNEIISKVIVGMINGIKDHEWLEERLFRLINNNDFWVRLNAIKGFSDLARIHKLNVNKNNIQEKLRIIKLEYQQLIGAIDETNEDLDIFIKTKK
jgi:hypothetical protein